MTDQPTPLYVITQAPDSDKSKGLRQLIGLAVVGAAGWFAYKLYKEEQEKQAQTTSHTGAKIWSNENQ
jgi:predicted negative regulator of RcsB-dependent stress response